MFRGGNLYHFGSTFQENCAVGKALLFNLEAWIKMLKISRQCHIFINLMQKCIKLDAINIYFYIVMQCWWYSWELVNYLNPTVIDQPLNGTMHQDIPFQLRYSKNVDFCIVPHNSHLLPIFHNTTSYVAPLITDSPQMEVLFQGGCWQLLIHQIIVFLSIFYVFFSPSTLLCFLFT